MGGETISKSFDLQTDNTSNHTALITKEKFADITVRITDWLAEFPDSSPIENL